MGSNFLSAHSVGWSRAAMKAWFLFLLLLSFQTSVSCKRRRRCPTGLKMNHKRRCIKGYSATSTSARTTDFLQKLASDLKNELGRDVLIPCSDPEVDPGPPVLYCEVCFKNDPGKVFCPPNEWADMTDITGYFNRSVYEDFSDWKCPPWTRAEVFSYWSGYDDGSMCDCGAPFYFQVKNYNTANFFPLKPGDIKWGVSEGSSIVDESTHTMSEFHRLGNDWNSKWESGETGDIPAGIWDSRPPTVAPASCSEYPDISSIFKFSYQKHSKDDGESVIEKIDGAPNDDRGF